MAARKSSHAAKPEKNSSSAPTGRPSRQVLNGLPAKTSTTAAASHAPTPSHRDAKFSSVHGNGLSNSQPPDKKRKAVEPPLPAQPLFVVPDLTAKKAAPTPARARLAAKRASPGVPPPKKQGGLGRGKNIKFCMDSSSEVSGSLSASDLNDIVAYRRNISIVNIVSHGYIIISGEIWQIKHICSVLKPWFRIHKHCRNLSPLQLQQVKHRITWVKIWKGKFKRFWKLQFETDSAEHVFFKYF